MTFRSFRNIQRATRISVCVTAVSKSHEFFVESSLTFLFFSTTTPTPSHQRVIILFPRRRKGLDFDDESMFFNDVGHYGVSICGGDVMSIFPRFALVLYYIPRPLCLSKVTFPPMSPCRIYRLIKHVCHHGVLVSDVDRVERFTLTLRLFDDVSTAAWFTFSIPTSNFSMTRRNFQSVLSVLFFYSIKSLWLFLHKHLCAIKML